MRYEVGKEWFQCNEDLKEEFDSLITYCNLTGIEIIARYNYSVPSFSEMKEYIFVHFGKGTYFIDVFIYVEVDSSRMLKNISVASGNKMNNSKDRSDNYRKINYRKLSSFIKKLKEELVKC